MAEPTDAARALAWVRVAAGLALLVAPRRIGGLLIGSDAQSAGARLFVAAFGARDMLLGTGSLRALRNGEPARRWVASCAAADAFDTVATLRSFAVLQPRRRVLTLVVSAAPALVGGWLASRLAE